jgi:putative membrane protein
MIDREQAGVTRRARFGAAGATMVGATIVGAASQLALAAGPAARYAVWKLDPGVLGWALAGAVVYGLLWRRLERRPPWAYAASFAAGLVATVLTLSSPLDTMGETVLLTMHMLEHMALTLVAATLLTAGIPRSMLERVRRVAVIGPLLDRFWNLSGMLLFSVVIALWHVPALYEAALRNESVHDFEHLCFLLFAMLFWGPIFKPIAPRKGRAGAPFRRLAGVLVAIAVNTALGSYLFFVQHVLYPTYTSAPRVWGLIDVLTDQSIAGGALWVMGDMAYIVAAVVLAAQWLQNQGAAGEPVTTG